MQEPKWFIEKPRKKIQAIQYTKDNLSHVLKFAESFGLVYYGVVKQNLDLNLTLRGDKSVSLSINDWLFNDGWTMGVLSAREFLECYEPIKDIMEFVDLADLVQKTRLENPLATKDKDILFIIEPQPWKDPDRNLWYWKNPSCKEEHIWCISWYGDVSCPTLLAYELSRKFKQECEVEKIENIWYFYVKTNIAKE